MTLAGAAARAELAAHLCGTSYILLQIVNIQAS